MEIVIRVCIVTVPLADVGVQVPVLLPGALRPLPLAPHISEDDKLVIENTTKLLNFLTGGNVSQSGGFDPESLRLVASLAPLFPEVVSQIGPEVITRLGGRLAARFIQDVFLDNTATAMSPNRMMR